jgi:catechol 2,3-dioxygenase-like lactoylglutathione lyase family enzyme
MRTQQSLIRGAVAGAALVALAACGGAATEEAAEPMAGEAPAADVMASFDPGIRNVSFLHVNVADMDRAVAWYEGVLGMETLRDNGGPSATQIVAEAGAMMHTHVIQTPDGEFQMELVEVSGVELRPQAASIQDPGAVMLALAVSDLDAVIAGARELGLDVVSTDGEVVVTEDRGRQIWVRDADGFISYLTQTTEPDSPSVSLDFLFLTAADLDETVEFYNSVFGLGLVAPGQPGPTSERILALAGNPSLTAFRLTGDSFFAGTPGQLRFQEFSGVERTPVHHRVQDPGGPIFTMTVEDFAGVMERVPQYGGMIGDGDMSATLAPDATFSWIRDPNGVLIRVSQAPPAE